MLLGEWERVVKSSVVVSGGRRSYGEREQVRVSHCILEFNYSSHVKQYRVE